MINSQRVLNDIIKTSQMGINGINVVMDRTTQPALRQALKVQRREYSDIEQQAKLLARQKGYKIDQLKPITRKMGALMSRGQLMMGEPNSKIAGMMIQGNTRGMILSLKNMRRCDCPDPQVADLSQKLLDTEKNNIVSMQGFV
jgi:hypothetical protein